LSIEWCLTDNFSYLKRETIRKSSTLKENIHHGSNEISKNIRADHIGPSHWASRNCREARFSSRNIIVSR